MEQQQCAPAQGAAVLRCAHRAVRQGLLATLEYAVQLYGVRSMRYGRSLFFSTRGHHVILARSTAVMCRRINSYQEAGSRKSTEPVSAELMRP